MKKLNLTKLISSVLVAFSIIVLTPVGANAITSNHIYTPIYTSEVYADSNQWDYRNGYWICATPDFHQAYANTWICTNGKWYYVEGDNDMVTNTWVDNYYVDDTGALVPTLSQNTPINKEQAIQTVLNDRKYIDKPNDKDISIVKIYNKTYYRIYTHITYPLPDLNGGTKYRTDSDTTAYINIYTGKLYYGINS
jgi:hypothetical protein